METNELRGLDELAGSDVDVRHKKKNIKIDGAAFFLAPNRSRTLLKPKTDCMTQVISNKTQPLSKLYGTHPALNQHARSCTSVWEVCGKETGTDAGLLTQTDIIIASFNSTARTHDTHTATCKTTFFPYIGFIPKIDIMFIYIYCLHLYYVYISPITTT